MFRCGNTDLGNSVSAFLSRGAVCILTSSCIKDMMEGPNFRENGKIPQKKKSTRFQLAFYTFIFVLIISALASIIFCWLQHKQAPEFCWARGSLNELSTPKSPDIMSWDWTLEHCNGFLEVEDRGQSLTIEQSGHYFVYAQVYRRKEMNETFTLIWYKKPNIVLNQVVGPKEGDKSGTVNFARLFFLNKGDKLYCKRNFDLDKLLPGNLSYWGLFKM